VEVKPAEAQFHNFSEVSDERVEDAADGRRVRLGIVGRLELALRTAVAFHHNALTTCTATSRTLSLVSCKADLQSVPDIIKGNGTNAKTQRKLSHALQTYFLCSIVPSVPIGPTPTLIRARTYVSHQLPTLFFSSLYTCTNSDRDFARLPLQTFIFCNGSCGSSVAATRSLFIVLYCVILCVTKSDHAVLCPLAPDPGDATEPGLRLVLALWALTEQYYTENKYVKRVTIFLCVFSFYPITVFVY